MRLGALDQVLSGRRDTTRWDEHCALAQQLGFEGFEPGLRADYATTQLWDPAGRRQLLEQARSSQVVISSVCLHSYWQFSFASADADTRARAAQIAQEGAIATADLGARNILVPLTCPDGVEDDLARGRWITGIRQCAATAEDSGVCLCLENVGKRFANKPEDVAAIVDAVGSPAVQVYYDPGNAVKDGLDPLAGVAILGSRIQQVHVKEIGAALLGDGQVPWPQILAALKGIGFDGWLVLETDTTEHPLAAAGYNLITLRKWLCN